MRKAAADLTPDKLILSEASRGNFRALQHRHHQPRLLICCTGGMRMIEELGDCHSVRLPSARDLSDVIGLSRILARMGAATNVQFSFQDVDFVTPGWMLLAIRTLRSFRDARPGTRCKVVQTHSSSMSYAAHAGFFEALGVKRSSVGMVPSTQTFLPIQQRETRDLFKDQPLSRRAGDIIQEDAERLSAVLAQRDDGILFDTLGYAIRETIRNVVEHSHAREYLVTAQCWVASGIAEIAIADAGIGIAASLRSNAQHAPIDDAHALRLAVKAGVSGTVISSGSDDEWANSGYGLYMARGLAEGKQGFALISGTAALISDGTRDVSHDSALPGTCVVLRLRAGSASLERRLADLVGQVSGSPSRASISARVR